MQKIKNKNGVTLIMLVVTIIVIMILSMATINIGEISIKENKDAIAQAELQIIQQVAISEYTKAKQLGYTNSNETPINFLGKYLEISSLPVDINWEIDEEPEEKYKAYYELTPTDLEKFEISNVKDTYILNYYTGEVYNKSKGKTSDGKNLYINAVTTDSKEDNDSFNDWEE